MVRTAAQEISIECDTGQIPVPALTFAALAVALEEQVSGLTRFSGPTLSSHKRTMSL
jgi:hypothetical protein